MDSSHIIHPTVIEVGGAKYRVAAKCRLSDEQAIQVLKIHLRLHGQKKKDRGKLCTVVTNFDQERLAKLSRS